MVKQRSADMSVLRWLAQQLEWERILSDLREARDRCGRAVERDRPAA